MSRILILNPCYYPGFRSGGPQRTIMNIADAFGKTNEIYILTQDCDMDCSESYDVETHKWVQVGNANVMYLPPKEYCFSSIWAVSRDFETVYACGLFCRCTIDAILMHKLSRSQKLYVAPMGVFSSAAIASKMIKKRTFLFLFKYLGLFQNVVWSLTSEFELEDAKKELGKTIKEYIIAEDLPRKVDFDTNIKNVTAHEIDKDEPLKVIFLSRVSPQKNLKYCAEVLKEIKNREIRFDIYGTLEDKKYWATCENLLGHLPSNIHYRYCGEVQSEDVIDTFSKYDAFLFPTKGENYGHVIYEALAAGCLVITSDQTPWQDLSKKNCGYVLPLDDMASFLRAIDDLANIKATNKLKEMRLKAIEYARNKYEFSMNNSGYRLVFDNSQ